MKYFKSPYHEFMSQFLWRVRDTRGLSQEPMAERLGITRRALSDLEKGKYLPKAETRMHLDLLLTPEEWEELRQGVARCVEKGEEE